MTAAFRIVAADRRQPGGAHPAPIALRVVGAGRAGEVLRRSFQDHLRLARQACGFRYLRFHGLFHEDMAVVKRTRDGRLTFSFTRCTCPTLSP